MNQPTQEQEMTTAPSTGRGTSQWVMAIVALAGLVFVVTFAMNYLGSRTGPDRGEQPREPLELQFFIPRTTVPANEEDSPLEMEERGTNHQDFWFVNGNDEAVTVGLIKLGCRCSSVELFQLPSGSRARLARVAASIYPIRAAGVLPALTVMAAGLQAAQKGVAGHELLVREDSVTIEPGALGWVRLHWRGDQPGHKSLVAQLWMDDPKGKTADLQVRVVFHRPMRLLPELRFGVVKDEDLVKGVTGHLLVWSSTRHELHLEAKATGGRDKPASDPFVVGKPIRVTAERFRPLLDRQLQKVRLAIDELPPGQIQCAYLVPITLKALAADGKTPFDLGPFRRRVRVKSSDDGVPELYAFVQGRVRGLVDIEGDEETGGVNFKEFPAKEGVHKRKASAIRISSEQTDLTLRVNERRKPEYLDAELIRQEKRDDKQIWELKVWVKAGKASGPFPRHEDPLYEDSAIYLEARIGSGKMTRLIRVPVNGNAID